MCVFCVQRPVRTVRRPGGTSEEKPRMSGRFVWYDLATTDIDKAKAFYSGLFGWTNQSMTGEFGEYHMWHVNEKGLGGIMPIGPDQQTPPHWLSYLTPAGTIEDAVAKASESGANVMMPVTPIPSIGKFAI